MEGSVERYGVTTSPVEINIWKSKNKIDRVVFILPDDRSVDISLEEASALKTIMLTLKEL